MKAELGGEMDGSGGRSEPGGVGIPSVIDSGAALMVVSLAWLVNIPEDDDEAAGGEANVSMRKQAFSSGGRVSLCLVWATKRLPRALEGRATGKDAWSGSFSASA
jgi:hypothetical protein